MIPVLGVGLKFPFKLAISERRERRGIEMEIEEAEKKKRKARDDRDVKGRERFETITAVCLLFNR